MQKIYIVLTHTGTLLSNIIKGYTKNEYSHISIALDEELNDIYSFGRVNPYVAFVGGFVKESLTEGTFKRFKKTETSVYELEVTNKQYKKIKSKAEQMLKHKKEYKFNILGLFFVAINKKVKKPNTFYCAEFVRYILENADIDTGYLPEIIKPEDFKKLKNINFIYKGKLRKYRTRIRQLEAPKNHLPPVIPIPTRAIV